jgi:hypothetical protein
MPQRDLRKKGKRVVKNLKSDEIMVGIGGKNM